jgi:pimeloyl-ACP methyl ester carboxylesterase
LPPPTMTGVTLISLNGHPTWAHLPMKKGSVVVLLHGAMSSSASMMKSIGPLLEKDFAVSAFDRRGHGRTGDTDAPFSYDDMADETIAFIDLVGRRVNLIGHSDGGNVALIVAMRRPDLLKRVVAIGANFHHDGLMPLTGFDTDSQEFEQWTQRFAALSPDGAEHALVVAEKTEILIATQPTLTLGDLASITVPVLVMAGDDDVATLSHTCSLYEAIPQGQLAIVPGTSHSVLKERTRESARIIRHFLRCDLPPVTEAPVRRNERASTD